MNTSWAKILVFGILFLVLGFILGRICGSGCGTEKCGSGGMHGDACAMHGMHGDACMHGMKGKCCTMKGDSAMDHHGMGGEHGLMDSTAVAH